MKTLFYRANTELFLMREKARDLLKNKSGAAMIEYSILIGLITAAVIATIVIVGGKIETAWNTLETNMTAGGM
jgi:pilus assembly protein Flp/PilA